MPYLTSDQTELIRFSPPGDLQSVQNGGQVFRDDFMKKVAPEWTHEGWMGVMARNGVSRTFLVGGMAYARPGSGTEYDDMRTLTSLGSRRLSREQYE